MKNLFREALNNLRVHLNLFSFPFVLFFNISLISLARITLIFFSFSPLYFLQYSFNNISSFLSETFEPYFIFLLSGLEYLYIQHFLEISQYFLAFIFHRNIFSIDVGIGLFLFIL